MLQNSDFQVALPTYCPGFSYFLLTPFSNFLNIPFNPMENMASCQFYENWNTNCQIKPQKVSSDLMEDIEYENGGAQQTSAGSKISEKSLKPKKSQAPRFRPTKNNQSNISNQVFSFIITEGKSKHILQSFLQNKRKTQLFYQYTKYLSSNRKKYISKGTLLKLCTLTSGCPQLDEILKLKTLNILSVNEFESGVCFLISHFLKHKSVISILTSQKIASNLKKDHISKVRQILNFIQQGLSARKLRPN